MGRGKRLNPVALPFTLEGRDRQQMIQERAKWERSGYTVAWETVVVAVGPPAEIGRGILVTRTETVYRVTVSRKEE